MKKILFLLPLLAIMLASCDETRNDHQVSYFITRSQSGCDVSYLDSEGNIIKTRVNTQSANDKVVVYSYIAKSGDVVYMSVNDTAANSFVQAAIYIDGKIYKQAGRSDDITMRLTVSGHVPFD